MTSFSGAYAVLISIATLRPHARLNAGYRDIAICGRTSKAISIDRLHIANHSQTYAKRY